MCGLLKGKLLPRGAISSNMAMVLGRYEPYVVGELLNLPTARVAYDIGSHIGFMTLVLAEQVGPMGKVFAFEPMPENLKVLEELVNLNNLKPIVQVLSIALSDSNGTQKILLRESSSMHLLEAAFDGANENAYRTLSVRTCTLDSFVFDHQNLAPDLIKIDVEGAEILVLRGALQTLQVYSPIMLIEIHGPRKAERTWDLLQSLRYSWVRLTPKGRATVPTKQELLSPFSRTSWTQHFVLTRADR